MSDEWTVEHTEHRPHPIVRAGDGRVVAEVQHEKDADLIAAAPELLEACERAACLLGDYPETLHVIRVAVAIARGGKIDEENNK